MRDTVKSPAACGGVKLKRMTPMEHIFPRVLICAPGSGSGKTVITCALLRILIRKGLLPASFKCGPDYIDPLFHKKVLGIPSRNLDYFLAGKGGVMRSLKRGIKDRNIGIIEGVMGFYDGMGASSIEGSSYDISRITGTPAILVINAKGMSRSAAALVKGFVEYMDYERNQIKGIILNNISPSIAADIIKLIEEEVHVPVIGYLPHVSEADIASRHLGLVLPDEIPELIEKIDLMADKLEENLNFEKLLEIAAEAETIPDVEESFAPSFKKKKNLANPQIAVAMDEAFCFYYEDNLDMLRDMGARITFFSPLHDKQLPKAQGYIIGGGYPELYAKELSENSEMINSIRGAFLRRVPIFAECGGFMYLQENMNDKEGVTYPMVGVIPGESHMTDKLSRFGYVTVTAARNNDYLRPFESISGHEFHYYDTSDNGDACIISKGTRNRYWKGIHSTNNLFAGFPHLYYPSCQELVERFLEKASGGL